MTRDEKIIRKMKQSPRNIRFEEVDGLLRRRGFVPGQPGKGSSHYTYRHKDGRKITVVKPHGGKKTVHKRAVEEVLEKLDL